MVKVILVKVILVKRCSAGPSIQSEIQCVERKGNLHGENQRQTKNLPKIVDTGGSKDVVVLSQGKVKGCLWWTEEDINMLEKWFYQKYSRLGFRAK